MPVTARLSRRFYEKFGDDIVNELVEWLNQVDVLVLGRHRIGWSAHPLSHTPAHESRRGAGIALDYIFCTPASSIEVR